MPATETRPARATALAVDVYDDLFGLGCRLARSGHPRVVPERFDAAEGKAILAGKRSLDDLSQYVLKRGLDPQPKSGKQEQLERLINDYI